MMETVRRMTGGRVQIGPGTLYNLLEKFLEAGMIEETAAEGRRRSYRINAAGRAALDADYRRLEQLAEDYRRFTAWPEAADALHADAAKEKNLTLNIKEEIGL